MGRKDRIIFIEGMVKTDPDKARVIQEFDKHIFVKVDITSFFSMDKVVYKNKDLFADTKSGYFKKVMQKEKEQIQALKQTIKDKEVQISLYKTLSKKGEKNGH